MISAPSAAWTVVGTPSRYAREQDRQLRVARASARASSARPSASPIPAPACMPRDERVVHLAAGLVGHAEGAVAQAGGDVLRRRAEARDLVVVNRRRAVHRDVRDDAAAHQIDEQRREPGLHDVAAEHDDDAALARARRRRSASTTARKSRATRTSGSASRNAANERSSRRRMRELARRSPCSGGARRESVRTAERSASRVARGVGPAAARDSAARSSSASWAVRFEVQVEGSEADLRLHLQHDAVVVVGEPDLGVAALEKMPLVLMIGCTTIASNSPAAPRCVSRRSTLMRDRVAVGAEVVVERRSLCRRASGIVRRK